ncbi:MAG: YihY/virulence factor BrkB family protein [Candidatus Nanopelagicales bacterium]
MGWWQGKAGDASEAITKSAAEVTGRGERAKAALIARIDQRPRLRRAIELIRRIIEAQSAVRLSLAAAGAAFWLVIALFPATIAAITIFGLVVNPQDIADAVAEISQRAPGSLGAVLAQQAQVAASTQASTLSIGLVISILVTLWSVSSGSYGLTRAIQGAYDVAPRPYVRARIRAFVFAFAWVLVLGALWLGVAAVAVWVSGLNTWAQALGWIVGVPIALVLQAAFYGAHYRYSISRHASWREQWPGAAVSSVAIALLVVGLGIYASYAPDYQAIYGALTGVILTMFAVYLGMYVVLLGAALNAQLTAMRHEAQLAK